MKLSDAMRLGSVLRKQAFWAIHERGKTCALGAAGEAVGVIHIEKKKGRWVWEGDGYMAGMKRHFPALFKRVKEVSCPVPDCREKQWKYEDLVVHLNDGHQWDRVRIADYLDQVGFEKRKKALIPGEVKERQEEPGASQLRLVSR